VPRAASDATVIELPRDELLREFERHPGLARRMIASLAREVQALTAHAHALTRKDAPARFAGWLTAQVEPAAGDAARARIRLGSRKRDLAGQLGVTPETLSRVMRGFSESGLIRVAGYTLEVLDLPALRALAERE
jgi:CRP-like cAMP-binding protein